MQQQSLLRRFSRLLLAQAQQPTYE
jgi:hypothetical protein